MGCEIKIKTIDYLKREGVLGEKRVIKDYTKFNQVNSALSHLAYTKYGIKGNNNEKLFTSISKHVRNLDGSLRYILRAEPNEDLFKILQKAVDEYKELDNDTKQIDFGDLFSLNEEEKFIIEELDEEDPFVDEKEKGTINEFILFGTQDNRKEFTAVEVLENITNHYSGFSKHSKMFLERAKVLMETTKAKVKLVNKELLFSYDTLMQWDSKNNTISISLDKLRDLSTNSAVGSFLHEVTHSVSSSAYHNPITLEQRMFRNFIIESYNYYFANANDKDKDNYGFTNATEFIAEIFVNPKFVERLRESDKAHGINGDKEARLVQRSFFSKLIDYIRTLFGMKRNISVNNVIESIVDMSFTKQVSGKRQVFEQMKIKSPIINIDDGYTSLKTIEDKLEYTVDKLEESLFENIKSLEFSAKVTKEEDKLKNIEGYIKDFKEILSNIQQLRLTNQIAAIATFLGKMVGNMNYIKNRIDNIDYSDKDKVAAALRVYKDYLTTFSVVKEIQDVISDIRTNLDTQDVVTKKDLENIEEILKATHGEYSYLEDRMYSVLERSMIVLLDDVKYFQKVEFEHRERLRKEFKESQLPGDMESWISQKMLGRDKEKIDKDVKQAALELIKDASYDILQADVLFSSAINVSSPLIQIMNRILFDIKNRKNEEIRRLLVEMDEVNQELVKEKGTNDIKTLFENILEFDSEGQPFFKSEFKQEFYDKVHGKLRKSSQKLREEKEEMYLELSAIGKKYGIDHNKYFEKKQQIKKIVDKTDAEIKKLKEDNINFDENGNVVSIKSKWKTDFSNLSEVEKKTLELIKRRIDNANKDTFGQQSLIKYSFGTKFYELPRVTKNNLERIIYDRGKGLIKDKLKDFTEIRPDDVGYSTIKTDLENNRVFNLKVHYRDRYKNFDFKDQSLDIMNIIRLETENGVNFRIRRESETILKSLLEIAKRKKYYQKEGTNKLVNFRSKKYNMVSGKETNTYKMMKNIIEQKFYDIFNKGNIKLGKVDLNKTVRFINSSSAFLTLSFNIASGTANVLNAKAQLFLESFLPMKGGFITASSIAKANRIYGSQMAAIMSDLTNPINKSFVNQLNELFDTKDTLTLTNSGFLRTNFIKAGFDSAALQVFHTSGEHWVQSVTAMAVLDGVKALNEQGKLINKEGKVVKTKKEAASLLDMLQVDKVNGVVTMSNKVVYTTHSKITKWDEGGKTNIDMLIRKKLYDTVGNYTQLDQPEIMRHWGGKLMMLYRKYLIPMGQARFRGWESSLTRKENLTDDQKRFSYALQENEEGTYITVIRYLATVIGNLKMKMLSDPKWNNEDTWGNLTDYEKHNIKRVVVETTLIYGLLPLMLMFVKGLADGDDDDLLYFLAYEIRRLDTELSQYQSMMEMFKMMRSPIPSARLIETTASSLGALLHFWDIDEVYKAGPNKGKNKWSTKIKKQIPVVKEFQRTYQGLLKYQESSVGTGL